MAEVLEVLKAVALGSVAFFLAIHEIPGVTNFPCSICVLEALLTVGLLAGLRLASRVLVESVRGDVASAKRVAVVGAGFAAQMILREIQHHNAGHLAVACVDDASKHRFKIRGVPVMDSVNELPGILHTHRVDEIGVAIPSAPAAQMERSVSICQRTGLKFRTVPALRDFISGKTAFEPLRDVNLEDLLGRDSVGIDLESVRSHLEGHTVLVAGAANSIGCELCRQILRFHPRKLLCLDQSETALF